MYGSVADAVGDGTQKRWAMYVSDAAIHTQSTVVILRSSNVSLVVVVKGDRDYVRLLSNYYLSSAVLDRESFLLMNSTNDKADPNNDLLHSQILVRVSFPSTDSPLIMLISRLLCHIHFVCDVICMLLAGFGHDLPISHGKYSIFPDIICLSFIWPDHIKTKKSCAALKLAYLASTASAPHPDYLVEKTLSVST